jgi:transposase
MYVQRDDHATGLIRLLSIALRVVTLLEFVGRRQLASEQVKLAGLYYYFVSCASKRYPSIT